MRRRVAVLTVSLFALLLVGATAFIGIGAVDNSTVTASSIDSDSSDDDITVSEEAYIEPAPEEGELYYEAGTSGWVSYINPQDEYRTPYLGDGSGKIGVTLLNEAGDPIVGESVPNTTVTIETGEELTWHSAADPITVQYPLTEHYDRPLASDQFGTTDDLPQGDGYMDTQSIEIHGLDEHATVEYGEVQIDGEHADKIDVVGYIEQANEAWDSDVDPIEDAESYEEVGGEWTYHPDGSHGQVIAVLQLDSDETGVEDESDDETNGQNEADETDETDEADETNETDETDETDEIDETDETNVSADDTDDSDNGDDGADGDDGDGGDDTDIVPGFGIPAVIGALTLVALSGIRRQTE